MENEQLYLQGVLRHHASFHLPFYGITLFLLSVPSRYSQNKATTDQIHQPHYFVCCLPGPACSVFAPQVWNQIQRNALVFRMDDIDVDSWYCMVGNHPGLA